MKTIEEKVMWTDKDEELFPYKTKDICKILSISKQRLHQLRKGYKSVKIYKGRELPNTYPPRLEEDKDYKIKSKKDIRYHKDLSRDNILKSKRENSDKNPDGY